MGKIVYGIGNKRAGVVCDSFIIAIPVNESATVMINTKNPIALVKNRSLIICVYVALL